MLILDRYIIRQFLLNFVILLVVLMSLYVMGDSMLNLDEFVGAGRYRHEQFGGGVFYQTLYSIVDFYGPMIALVYVFFSGLLVVGAMGFTFASMLRAREMVALTASGVDMYRIAMPVLVVGSILNLLTIANQERVIPPLADKLTRGHAELKQPAADTKPIFFVPDGEGHLFSAVAFASMREELTELTILVRDEKGQTLKRITATQAIWRNEPEPGWELVMGNGIAWPQADQLTQPDAAPRLTHETFFATDLSPEVLQVRQEAIYSRLLSFSDLRRMQDNPAANQRLIRRLMHSRFSLVVMNVLILLMGMPFFLRRVPGNLFLPTMRAAGLCLGCWTIGLVVLQVGSGEISPVLSAWLPVVAYLPISAAMMLTIKT